MAGMETAFTASMKGSGNGPKVASWPRTDALPGIGHACGHNIIGTSAIGAALGLRAALGSLDGTLVVFGTPAEEMVGGKIKMVDADCSRTSMPRSCSTPGTPPSSAGSSRPRPTWSSSSTASPHTRPPHPTRG